MEVLPAGSSHEVRKLHDTSKEVHQDSESDGEKRSEDEVVISDEEHRNMVSREQEIVKEASASDDDLSRGYQGREWGLQARSEQALEAQDEHNIVSMQTIEPYSTGVSAQTLFEAQCAGSELPQAQASTTVLSVYEAEYEIERGSQANVLVTREQEIISASSKATCYNDFSFQQEESALLSDLNEQTSSKLEIVKAESELPKERGADMDLTV